LGHQTRAGCLETKPCKANNSLPDDVPPEVVEQLAAVTAGVCYDVGDQEALQRALAELGESSRRLVQAGATQAHGPDAEKLRGALVDVESRLVQAESVLGRVGLPGEAGGQVGVS
jgi:hypothetical protein